jgi:hydroxyacylglutathione hydrolase
VSPPPSSQVVRSWSVRPGAPTCSAKERADTLARLQYRSVRRLAELDGEVGLYPTHGEGSFCTASGAGTTTSTIEAERLSNPVLAYPDEDSFVAGQLAGLQPYPTYYARMGPTNLYGPSPVPSDPVPVIDSDRLASWPMRSRSSTRVTSGSSPPATSRGLWVWSCGTTSGPGWVGWPTTTPRWFSSSIPARIGTRHSYSCTGSGSTGSWASSWAWMTGKPTALPLLGFRTARLQEFTEATAAGAQILDVRSPGEWEESHIGDSIHSYLPDLAASLPDLDPNRPVWIGCGSGYRAAIAAGQLVDAGYEPVVLIEAGIPDVCRQLRTEQARDGVCEPPLAAVR